MPKICRKDCNRNIFENSNGNKGAEIIAYIPEKAANAAPPHNVKCPIM